MSVIFGPAQIEQFIRDGYAVARGLIAPGLAAQTRRELLQALAVDEADASTWKGKSVPFELAQTTASCRTPEVEAAALELIGPNFVRGLSFSPYLEARGVQEPTKLGFIPVLNFPQRGARGEVLPREFVPPDAPPHGYHIDGMHRVTLFPEKFYLVVFAYLNDVAEHGGATTILPGSHRQVFEHHMKTGTPTRTLPPDLGYAPPRPMPGRAGDVIFMHYLAVHSGSPNRSDVVRVGLNTAVMPDVRRPYEPKHGAPQPGWTPLDWTLRSDNL